MEEHKQRALIEVQDLKKYFPLPKSLFKRRPDFIKAVDGVSFHISKGETFGLVGESGCGKSSIARTIIRLYQPDQGKILLNGDDITFLDQKELLPYRKKMQMIFQDPYSSLNSRMTVKDIIGEPLDVHQIFSVKEKEERIFSLLEQVGLKVHHAGHYPHEFSGGQRQRIGIARALAVNPDFIICDEPISALDVSIQAQVVNMLEDLQQEMGLTYLFIAHDLSMVRHISDTTAVMYLGKMVEYAESERLYREPLHPYTQALLSANPIADPRAVSSGAVLEGDVPSPVNLPRGCRFQARCAYVMPRCREREPELQGSDHKVACFLHNK